MNNTDIVFTNPVKDAIRLAAKRGKRSIVINGRKFSIEIYNRDVSFQTGGTIGKGGVKTGAKTTSRTERWLRVKPANGDQVPMCCIETISGRNLRIDSAIK